MAVTKSEIETFRKAREHQRAEAHQTAALFLISGVDLSSALHASGGQRVDLLRRLKRLLERERLKGVGGHWSYDLNRHIALGQALRRLQAPAEDGCVSPEDDEAAGEAERPGEAAHAGGEV